eukprot:GHVU01103987.1.p1 GENE.GHVU01103987.1~~GHVU01103987.1.p1  ORF type:complete len:258 (-),score=30.23 GHVU01103987.1:665-1438(-)
MNESKPAEVDLEAGGIQPCPVSLKPDPVKEVEANAGKSQCNLGEPVPSKPEGAGGSLGLGGAPLSSRKRKLAHVNERNGAAAALVASQVPKIRPSVSCVEAAVTGLPLRKAPKGGRKRAVSFAIDFSGPLTEYMASDSCIFDEQQREELGSLHRQLRDKLSRLSTLDEETMDRLMAIEERQKELSTQHFRRMQAIQFANAEAKMTAASLRSIEELERDKAELSRLLREKLEISECLSAELAPRIQYFCQLVQDRCAA